MLSTRPSPCPLECHSDVALPLDPERASTCSSSAAHHSPQAKASIGARWSPQPSAALGPIENLPYANQDSASANDAASTTGTRDASRVGYGTRSTTGKLQRNNFYLHKPTMGPAKMFANVPAASSGTLIRKKRRRYGPKPEPPYTCFCGKVFKRHEHMLRHRATHDDGIKYECHICGKCFRRQDVMHRHTMTHTSRSRLQNKLRTPVTSSTTSTQQSTSSRKRGDESKSASGSRAGEPDYTHLDPPVICQDTLEDPLLRVGLADYPATPTSVRYNEDHHIAAAQLYSACNATRYSHASYPGTLAQGYGIDMNERAYTRTGEYGGMAEYHTRSGSSMSPPPPFFASPTGFAPDSFATGQYGVAMTRPHFGLAMLPLIDYEPKDSTTEAGHYSQSCYAGYTLAHGSMHVGASESEWSEQSPSVPSTHTFASPAWSQRAELSRREESASAPGGTPCGVTNRQLSLDPAVRLHSHQQPQHASASALLGGDSLLAGMHRSPSDEPRRRLATYYAHESLANMAQDGHGVKVEGNSDYGGVGLGLFDPLHSHDSGHLGSLPTPTLGNTPTMGGNERLPMLQSHTCPHVANSALLASSSYDLGAGMSSMQVSQGTATGSTWYASEGKAGFTSLLNASEPLDTGSPLTEATGYASPHSHAYGSSTNGRVSTKVESKQEAAGAPIDAHMVGASNGYSSSSSTASMHGGANSSRW